jgi:DNA mismatch endonuclease (patch repair protein)
MSRIHCRDTRPELKLRRALWRTGFRYRLGVDLPGRPDLCFVDKKVAVFVDGCFWHGCPCHYSAPASHEEFWAFKLQSNVERDLVVIDALSAIGWRSLRIWEHELVDVVRLIAKVAALVGSSRDTCAYNREASVQLPHCECGSTSVRVRAVGGPGSLRPKSLRRPKWVELVCLECRQVSRQVSANNKGVCQLLIPRRVRLHTQSALQSYDLRRRSWTDAYATDRHASRLPPASPSPCSASTSCCARRKPLFEPIDGELDLQPK